MGATDLKAEKEKIVKTYLQVSLFYFLQKMKWNQANVCFLYSPLFSANNTRMQNRKHLLFAAFFTLPLLCFLFLLFAMFFSVPYSLFFSSVSALSLLFSALLFPPLARSLEGFIYSLTYLYLGKIQCINSRMQIPADVQ